jgi:O-antigen/teichoic acid export membrane protein
MTSLPRRFTRNALSNYAGVMVSLVLAVVVTPIMIRGLGKEGFGVWGLATTVVQYLGLLQLGFGNQAAVYLGRAEARQPRQQLHHPRPGHVLPPRRAARRRRGSRGVA